MSQSMWRGILALCLFLGACTPAVGKKPESGGTATPQEAQASPATPATVPAAQTSAAPVEAYIRLNQVGYLPEDQHMAVVLTNAELENRSFEVIGESGDAAVFSGPVGVDRGRYGNFAHLYELDFSRLTVPGRYRVRLVGVVSLPFEIGAQVYQPLPALSLQFFRVQRCGDAQAQGHGACHLKDGVAAGGAQDGQTLDASGGWHDAGDYLKFMITSGYAADLILSAYQRHPQAFAGEAVWAEGRVGLDWMLKMWDAKHQVLYYQVGDESDHDEWRMPEGDDAAKGARKVWACQPGRGANVAGKAAAALALGAVIARENGEGQLAERYLLAARQIYRYGMKNPEIQPSNPADFYAEESWQDDMALAAIELYRATGEASYLNEARQYARLAGGAAPVYWGELSALAYYEIGRLDPTFMLEASTALKQTLMAALERASKDAFHAGVGEFFWGSAENMAGLGLAALWYEDLSGDPSYRILAQWQRDYLLGGNPWGVSWLNGAGSQYAQHPHHQVADLGGAPLTGFWDEGAVPRSEFEAQQIEEMVGVEDPYAAFQSDGAVYHDHVADYVTNEPTITMNATGLALAAWYAGKE